MLPADSLVVSKPEIKKITMCRNCYDSNLHGANMLIVEKGISNEMVEEKIKELKPIHPELAQVAETIREMDLKATVNTILVVDEVEALLKVHGMREARGKALTDETAERIVRELRPKHPILAAVIERGHKMDLKETFAALIVIDAIKRILKIHAARLAAD